MKALLLAGVSALALTAGGASAGQNTFPTLVRSNYNAVHFTPRKGNTVLYDQANSSNFFLYAADSDVLESSPYAIYDSAGADDFVIPGTAEHRITAIYAPGQNAYGSGYTAANFDVTFYKKIKAISEFQSKVKVLKICPSSPASDLNGDGDVLIDVKSCGVKVRGGHDYDVSVQAITPSGLGEDNWWYWQTNSKQIGTEAWWTNYGGGFAQCTLGFAPIQTCMSTIGPDFAFELFGK